MQRWKEKNGLPNTFLPAEKSSKTNPGSQLPSIQGADEVSSKHIEEDNHVYESIDDTVTRNIQPKCSTTADVNGFAINPTFESEQKGHLEGITCALNTAYASVKEGEVCYQHNFVAHPEAWLIEPQILPTYIQLA